MDKLQQLPEPYLMAVQLQVHRLQTAGMRQLMLAGKVMGTNLM